MIYRRKPNQILNIIQYAQRQRKDFHQLSFHEVDSLILAQFSYLNFSRFVGTPEENTPWVPLHNLYKAEEFPHMMDKAFFPRQNKALWQALCASPRYRDVEVNYFVNRYDKASEEQFCAVSYRLPTGETVIAFRGTDVGIVGWKEDFNMLYLAPVPSQISATQYLQEVGNLSQGTLYVTGHSKGGNLAVYAGLFVGEELRNRVERIYDLDGPGFPMEVIGPEKRQEIEEKVIKIRPEGSIVGAIFQSTGQMKVVKCHKSGIKQHEAFTWLIYKGRFLPTPKVRMNVKHMDRTMNNLAMNLTREQRQRVVDFTFSLLQEIHADQVSDIGPLLVKEKETIARSLKELDVETATCIKEFLRTFVRISIQSVFVKGKEAGPMEF